MEKYGPFVLVFVIGACLGAAAALAYYCPVVCKAAVKGKATGFLAQLVGVDLATKIVDEVKI